jgi:hypothetical protein
MGGHRLGIFAEICHSFPQLLPRHARHLRLLQSCQVPQPATHGIFSVHHPPNHQPRPHPLSAHPSPTPPSFIPCSYMRAILSVFADSTVGIFVIIYLIVITAFGLAAQVAFYDRDTDQFQVRQHIRLFCRVHRVSRCSAVGSQQLDALVPGQFHGLCACARAAYCLRHSSHAHACGCYIPIRSSPTATSNRDRTALLDFMLW